MFKFITKPIGCIFSIIGFFFVLAILMVVGFFWAMDEMAPRVAESAITQATGFPTTVQDGEFSFRNQSITLTDIEIDNPSDFPEREFMRIAEFTVGLDRDGWSEEQMALSEIKLVIDEMAFIQGDMQVSNLETFIESAEENWAMMLQQIYAQAATEGQTVPDKMVINNFHVELRRIRLASISGQETVYRTIDLDYSKDFTKVEQIRPVIETIAKDMEARGLNEIGQTLQESAEDLDNANTLQQIRESLEQSYQQNDAKE